MCRSLVRLKKVNDLLSCFLLFFLSSKLPRIWRANEFSMLRFTIYLYVLELFSCNLVNK